MRVAVTATGTDLDSGVDERFGRARYFVVVDSDTDEVLQVIDNLENQHAQHGAGVQAAQSIVDADVQWLLTGNVGPNAFSIMSSAGVEIGIGASGTVRDALEGFKAGDFEAIEGPTRKGHQL